MTAVGLQSDGGRILKIGTGVSIAVLQSASIFEGTPKIDTGDSVEGERSVAVQPGGLISGDAGRTSFSEGKVNGEEWRDIT